MLNWPLLALQALGNQVRKDKQLSQSHKVYRPLNRSGLILLSIFDIGLSRYFPDPLPSLHHF